MNAFKNALSQLDRANSVKGILTSTIARVSKPEREITISIPVKMDDGSIQVFEGYRVQHSSARGPYKGGIRFHPQADIDEVRALAFWMTMKCAVANIGMGGGKGGITVDPKKLSKGELERLSRGWVKKLQPVIGPKQDVPAPDVNTTPEIMSWMVDEYSKLTGDTTNAAFTGKPLDKGGSEGRGAATGMGGYIVFDALKKNLDLDRPCTVVIQGMGNVGGNAGRIFREAGHTIIAISDSKGGIVNEKGMDPVAVEQYKKQHGSIKGYPGTRYVSNDELLLLSCDILIPAALENQITKENAANIKAKLVLELANGPTTPEADDIMYAKHITVVPDILANSGGVVVSTFEWEQNLKGQHWSEAEVFGKLKELLAREAHAIFALAKELDTDLRRAAFCVALERVEKAFANEK